MKKLVVANWKANPATVAEAEDILAATDEYLAGVSTPPDLVFCPPFVFLTDVLSRLGEGRLVAAAALGAQDIAASDDRAQTGEVSGAQLKALGVRYVIVGHSERRAKLGEPDDVVHAKLLAALRHGITPILCVEEPGQLESAVGGLEAREVAGIVIAYEPSWAISTNPGARPDTPDNAVASSAFIRGTGARILYGGSVTPDNARGFLEHFDGVLVGGASVRKADFTAILSQS